MATALQSNFGDSCRGGVESDGAIDERHKRDEAVLGLYTDTTRRKENKSSATRAANSSSVKDIIIKKVVSPIASFGKFIFKSHHTPPAVRDVSTNQPTDSTQLDEEATSEYESIITGLSSCIQSGLRPRIFQPFAYEYRLKRQSYTFGKIQPENPVDNKDGLSGEYDMTRRPHGIAIIINNQTFLSDDERIGTDKDGKNLTTLCRYLGYWVLVWENLCADQMVKVLDDIAGMNHEKYDSFICCILSHGHNMLILGSDSQQVKLNQLTEKFNTNDHNNLMGKPKIFVIEACRTESGCPENDLVLRNVDDFVFCFPTVKGHRAFRDEHGKGSWYIQEVCKAFAQYSTCTSFEDIMEKVNESVRSYSKGDINEDPEVKSYLDKSIFFF